MYVPGSDPVAPLYGIAAAWAFCIVAQYVRRRRAMVLRPVQPGAVSRSYDVRMFCYVRGLYGDYPRQFQPYFVRLAADGLDLQPVRRRRLPPLRVTEPLLSVRERPFESVDEARRLSSTGAYGPGGSRQRYGKVVLSCRTARGVLEFAVPRSDAPDLVAWIDIAIHRQAAVSAGQHTLSPA